MGEAALDAKLTQRLLVRKQVPKDGACLVCSCTTHHHCLEGLVEGKNGLTIALSHSYAI